MRSLCLAACLVVASIFSAAQSSEQRTIQATSVAPWSMIGTRACRTRKPLARRSCVRTLRRRNAALRELMQMAILGTVRTCGNKQDFPLRIRRQGTKQANNPMERGVTRKAQRTGTCCQHHNQNRPLARGGSRFFK